MIFERSFNICVWNLFVLESNPISVNFFCNRMFALKGSSYLKPIILMIFFFIAFSIVPCSCPWNFAFWISKGIRLIPLIEPLKNIAFCFFTFDSCCLWSKILTQSWESYEPGPGGIFFNLICWNLVCVVPKIPFFPHTLSVISLVNSLFS